MSGAFAPNASSSLAQSHAVSAGVPCCVRGKQQHTPLGPSSKRRPIFTTTGWPSVHHYTMPAGQFVLANGLAGAEQRVAHESHRPFATRPSARLVTLFPRSTTTTSQLFVSDAFSKRSHPSSACPPTAARPLINELLTTRASCPRRGLWPGLALFSHNPRRQLQRTVLPISRAHVEID